MKTRTESGGKGRRGGINCHVFRLLTFFVFCCTETQVNLNSIFSPDFQRFLFLWILSRCFSNIFFHLILRLHRIISRFCQDYYKAAFHSFYYFKDSIEHFPKLFFLLKIISFMFPEDSLGFFLLLFDFFSPIPFEIPSKTFHFAALPVAHLFSTFFPVHKACSAILIRLVFVSFDLHVLLLFCWFIRLNHSFRYLFVSYLQTVNIFSSIRTINWVNTRPKVGSRHTPV